MALRHLIESTVLRTSTRSIDVDCFATEGELSGERVLFVFNHDDHAFEFGVLDWYLHRRGLPPATVVVGKNLNTNPFVRALIETTWHEAVPRGSGMGGRIAERIEELYPGSVAVAQQNGRSRTGEMWTHPAMPRHWRRASGMELEEYLERTAIIPVVASTQYQPSIIDRALKHPAVQREGIGDFACILRTLTRQKGHAHLAIGAPVTAGTDEELLEAIDSFQQRHRRIYDTNAWAYEQRAGLPLAAWATTPVEIAPPLATLRRLPAELQPVAVSIYAMPAYQRSERENGRVPERVGEHREDYNADVTHH